LSFGHLQRCITLNRWLQKAYDLESIFVMRAHPEGVRFAQRNGCSISRIPLELDTLKERELFQLSIHEYRPDWLIFDLPYEFVDNKYVESFKTPFVKILFMDDYRFISPRVDAIQNSNILAPLKTKINESTATRFFLGPDYFIFDDDVIDTDAARISNDLNVLLTYGGSDPADLTLKSISALGTKTWPGVRFTIVLGPGYENYSDVHDMVKPLALQTDIFHSPEELIPLMAKSDLVICGGGRTLYELCCLGTPFLPVASTQNESEVIKAFLDEGIIQSGLLCWRPIRFLETLTAMLAKLMNS
jgi:spore coat polysaccharide biosynthesis predicted glycosyltransferase SpsG